jgi:hypothetical protein
MARQTDGSTFSRLTSRLDRRELQRQSLPGGGTVYRGEVASRALDALGARAMTLDRSIIVSDDFDPSKPEDQALFAHEQYHAEHGDGGGGGGGQNFRDAEEVAARAVERMVLHRAAGDGAEAGGGGGHSGAGGAGSGTNSADSAGGGTGSAPRQTEEGAQDPRFHRKPDPSRGYEALRQDGSPQQRLLLPLGNSDNRSVAASCRSTRGRFPRRTGTGTAAAEMVLEAAPPAAACCCPRLCGSSRRATPSAAERR